jgi:hypothetical protein
VLEPAPKIAVNPDAAAGGGDGGADCAGGAGGVGRTGGGTGDGVRGMASIITVGVSITLGVSPDAACWSIHVGRSVNVARKCVMTTCFPSTVSTSKIFAVASGSNEPSRATSR